MSETKKQTLRAFQSRLAQRLQSVQGGADAASWLAVRAGSMRLLVPLSHAAEIFAWTDVQPLPHVRPWFLGVANLRGNLMGVVDLAAYLTAMGGPEAEAGSAVVGGRSSMALAQCRLVTFNPVLEMNAALLVDELLGMRTMAAFVRSEPAEAGGPAFFSQRYTDAQGQLWHEINLQSLSQQAEFLDIGASAS